MGRTDLARFRKTAPSVTPPASFPQHIRYLLDNLHAHPLLRAAHVARAVRSLNDSPSQSAQVASAKLLGVILFETHNDATHPFRCIHHNPCQDPNSSLSSCQLITPVLLAFLFDAPDAMPSLISACLRSLLRLSHFQLPLIQNAFSSFFLHLQRTPYLLQNETDQLRRNPLPSYLCCRINTTAVILSHPQAKKFIYDHPKRIIAVLHLIRYITDLFILITSAENGTNHTLSHNVDTQAVNTTLITAACDSSMKAANDTLNAFYTRDISFPIDDDFKVAISQATACCYRLLHLPSTPRSCSLACAVTFVTGHILLNCNYNDTNDLINILQTNILLKAQDYPPFSQLSILRAVMEAPITIPALSSLLFPSASYTVDEIRKDSSTIFSILNSLTSASSDVHFRYLAMETVISCIKRAPNSMLSEGCRDVVLSLVYQRWEEPFAGVTSQIRDTMDALVSVDGNGEKATNFWRGMATTLLKGDWTTKGIYSPLCVLVRRIGASTFLDIEPKCQTFAMYAMSNDSRLTKAVSDWLDAFWTNMKKELDNNYHNFVQLTAHHVVDALLHNDNRVLRERTAEHVLPVYMQSADKRGVSQIGQSLLTFLSAQEDKQRRASLVRGSIMVMSVARKKGVSLGNFSDPVVRKLLRDALNSGEEDLRTSAFDLVVTSTAPTEPITQAELDLVLEFLPIALMPGGAPADRSRFRHSMRRFFERFAACRHAAQEGSGGWWSRQKKRLYGGNNSRELVEERKALLARLELFEKRCVFSLMACAYPGASFTRRTSAMEIIKMLVVNLGSSTLLALNKDSSCSANAEISSMACLMAGLVDEWERPRRTSLDVIQVLPAPLPGLSSIDQARTLLSHAKILLDSARQNDVDSGASICRVIFQKFVLVTSQAKFPNGDSNGNGHVANDVQTLTFDKAESQRSDTTEKSPALIYAMSVLDSIEELISLSKSDFEIACAHGLFHGRFLVLRYLVQDFPWKTHMVTKSMAPLNDFIQRFLDLADQCIQISLEGVSFQKFNAGVPNNLDELDGSSVNQLDDDEERDAIFLAQGRQLESTSCFLSAKEICVSLGVLCHQAPLCGSITDETSNTRSKNYFLNQKGIERIGNIYAFVFTNTRHWGVIDGASEGLQLLSERMLSSSSVSLRALPEKWAMDILHRALSGELYVLRRSAGVPWLINAIVNAESSVNRRSHESPIMNKVSISLLDHMHLANKDEYKQTRTESTKGSVKDEESMSHALNLLRALFLNSNIGSNVMKHLESAALCCIDAFCSTSWLVRNSAMMLYSALILRGIGVCRERKFEHLILSSSFKALSGTSATLEGMRRLNGTTAFQFFSRHPKLYPFLLEHLKRAIMTDQRSGVDHPVLYPTLYLLSCLSPNTNEDPSVQISMSKFWDLVRKCVHWRIDYVRRAAAAACVALIDDCTQVPLIIKSILDGLPSEPTSVSTQLESSNTDVNDLKDGAMKTVTLNQNWLHGELLTMSMVLRNALEIMNASDKKKLVTVLIEALPRVVWIAADGTKNKCFVTRGSMVDFLTLSYHLSIDCENETILSICDEIGNSIASEKSVGVEIRSQIGFSAFRIKSLRLFGDILLRRFEKGYCNLGHSIGCLCDCMENPGEAEEGLIGCMETCSILLSKGANEVTEKFMKSVLGRLWTIIERILKVQNQRSESIIAALSLWVALLDSEQAAHIVRASISKWHVAFRFAELDSCIDVQEQALIVLGSFVRFPTFCNDKSVLKWMDTVVKNSKSQAPSLRMAAATSLMKSRNIILSENELEKKEVIAQGYITLGYLLEDDSAEVRTHALKASQAYLMTKFEHDDLDGHFLPTLMRIYKVLSESYSECTILFSKFEQFLGRNNCKLEDKLMNFVSHLIGLREDNEMFGLRWKRYDAVDAELGETKVHNGDNDGRLFRLEAMCADGEVVLQMQLVAWCYAQVLDQRRQGNGINQFSITNGAREAESQIGCSDIMQMIIDMVQELEVDFEEMTSVKEQSMGKTIEMVKKHSVMGGSMFTIKGFVHCVRSTLRIFIGMGCAFCAGINPNDNEFIEVSQTLQNLLKKWGTRLHPVTKSSVEYLTEMSMGKTDSTNDGRILFLLPTESRM